MVQSLLRADEIANKMNELELKENNKSYRNLVFQAEALPSRRFRALNFLNANKGKKERIGRLLEMHANSREDVKVALAGDIIALASLKDTITGETLCDPHNPIMLERMNFPDPMIKVAIEPKTKIDVDKMAVV